ncbi:MAG: glycosyltransferase family 2 protein [Candidatus Coatesbacteria bacterium]|nr:MAG: glycosyltransferase family 2 protein [Candidatus Coatesbacteria bacterium]
MAKPDNKLLISGVTFVRNAVKFDYPLVEAVRSILPVVDEYILLVCESDDDTLALARSFGDPKVRVYESDWDETLREGGRILAAKTDEAIAHTRGTWVFYLQADEVVHEDDLARIRELSERYAETPEVEGLVFEYLHFYGTYFTVQRSRKWYAQEVRVVCNVPELRSFGDAQGFRVAGRKPRAVASGARIFHYGWVRPPEAMLAKMRAFHSLWHDDEWVASELPETMDGFDYGPMRSAVPFDGTHPAVMAERIAAAGWTPENLGLLEHSHDRLGQRVLGWFERNVICRKIGEHRNFKLIRPPE